MMDIMQALIFLQGLPSDRIPIDGAAVPGALAAIAAILVGFLILFFVFVIFTYIYGSIAFMSISKRVGIGPAGIAWIPLIGKPLLASRIASSYCIYTIVHPICEIHICHSYMSEHDFVSIC